MFQATSSIFGVSSQPSSLQEIPTTTVVEQGEKEEQVSTLFLSDKHAEELAQVKGDYSLLLKMIEIIQISHDDFKLKQFLKHRALCVRLETLFMGGFSWHAMDELANFLQTNPSLLKKPFIQKFLAKQLVRIQAQLEILSFCGEKIYFKEWADFWSESCKEKIQRLFVLDVLPKAIKEPLKAILDRIANKDSSPISLTLGKRSTFEKDWYYVTKRAMELAVTTAWEIDGHDFVYQGLRVWIHQPRSNPSRAPDLIIKDIEEFETGRRNFIFSYTDFAPSQNYKEVMLYIVQSLKRDCETYYTDNPGYIDPSEYEKTVAYFIKNERFPSSKDERYEFEWAARNIVELEMEIKVAEAESEIIEIMQKFKAFYYHLRNFNIDLTICACISSQVFTIRQDKSWKPVIHFGVPESLKKLAAAVYICKESNECDKFNSFGCLHSQAHYYPKTVQKTIEELHEIYNKLAEDPQNLFLVQEFYAKWFAFPERDKLKSLSENLDNVLERLGSYLSLLPTIRMTYFTDKEFHSYPTEFTDAVNG